MNINQNYKNETTDFESLCSNIFTNNTLIITSHRSPIEITQNNSSIDVKKSGTTVATAFGELIDKIPFSWITNPTKEIERKLAANKDSQGIPISSNDPTKIIHYINSARRIYHKYYNIICNPLLWYLHHQMWNFPYNPNIDENIKDAWFNGYVNINENFANAIVKETQKQNNNPIIIVQDYHLYLVPELIRKLIKNSFIHYIIYTPWTSSRSWAMLPSYIRNPILTSLLCSNLIIFQTKDDARNFLNCCEEFLSDITIDYPKLLVTYKNHSVKLNVAPISINIKEINTFANSAPVMIYEKELEKLCTDSTIVRIDRAEPTKNILRGFEAYKIMLEKETHMLNKVTFLAFLAPSRLHISQYKRYLIEIENKINQINTRFQTKTWKPIIPFYENNYAKALAGLKIYDVFLQNATIDGTNLVTKQAPIVNKKNGTIILSETSSVCKELTDYVVKVAPTDLTGTAESLYESLITTQKDRTDKYKKIVEHIESHDNKAWLTTQLQWIKDLL
jgi:trehalose 6-phosphate synthase